MTARRVIVAIATAALLVTACSSGPDPSPTSVSPTPSEVPGLSTPGATMADYYAQEASWSPCKDGFECTRIAVPLDYDDPQAGELSLDVVRLPGKHSTGSLLVNPGGPGGSAVELARIGRYLFSKAVLDKFDIVGVDPRGVVGSTPVDCVDDAELDTLMATDGTPDDTAEVADLEAVSADFAAGCQQRSPQLAAHIDTYAAAKDLDVVRAVLGEDTLNFLGFSYATYLDAVYAELFPDRVGRMVLDGALPSSLDSDGIAQGQARGFDDALKRFAADCPTHDDCPLPADPAAGVAAIADFIDGLDGKPLPGVGQRELTQALGMSAILSYLYAPPTDWEQLRNGLTAALAGDGSVLLGMLDYRIERDSDGTFANNTNEAFLAVSCLDRPAQGGPEHAAALAKDWAQEAPVFGALLAWGNQVCWKYPLGTGEPVGGLAPITAAGAPPILVLSTTHDPATPYAWGVQVADELADAVLLTLDGDGHTAYGRGSTCIDTRVDDYLLTGAMPAEGTVCKQD